MMISPFKIDARYSEDVALHKPVLKMHFKYLRHHLGNNTCLVFRVFVVRVHNFLLLAQ